jgi:hypothetical protein
MALVTQGLKMPYSCVPSSVSRDLSFNDTHLQNAAGYWAHAASKR